MENFFSKDNTDLQSLIATINQNFNKLLIEIHNINDNKLLAPQIEESFNIKFDGKYTLKEAAIIRERLKKEYKIFSELIVEYHNQSKEQFLNRMSSRGILNSGIRNSGEELINKEFKRLKEILDIRYKHILFELERAIIVINKVTVDTNILINYINQKTINESYKIIIVGYFTNKIDLAVTNSIDNDLISASKEMKDKIVPFLKSIPVLKPDSPKEINDLFIDKVFNILRPKGSGKRNINDKIDSMHITCHILLDRDLFITEDKNILKKKKELEVAFKKNNLLIACPDEAGKILKF